MEEFQKKVAELKPILKVINDLEEEMKAAEEKKDALAAEILELMPSDDYTTDFATLSKKTDYSLELEDEDEAEDFLIPIQELDRDMVVEHFEAFGYAEGVKVKTTVKLSIRKNKKGLV